MLLSKNRPTLRWRSLEREAAESIFGLVADEPQENRGTLKAEYVRWFPESENTTANTYQNILLARAQLNEAKHINDPLNFLNVHDKCSSFSCWNRSGVRTPHWFEFSSVDEFFSHTDLSFPLLLRLNNGVAGMDSMLIQEAQLLHAAVPQILTCAQANKGRGVNTKALCVEFIETQNSDGVRVSYRVIVAGNRVITGYARTCSMSDWVAITTKFTASMWSAWLNANIRCQELMVSHERLFVDAVHSLGLNYQAIDVIEDQEQNLYFLEVQTTYDAGFIGQGHYVPPFFNPYNPELVQLLIERKDEVRDLIPLYVENWLEKYNHFRLCYSAVKELLDA